MTEFDIEGNVILDPSIKWNELGQPIETVFTFKESKQDLERAYRLDIEYLNEARTMDARRRILDRISVIRRQMDSLENAILNYYRYLQM